MTLRTRIIFWLGKRSKWVRDRFYRKTGRYLWGIVGMVHDHYMMDDFNEEWFRETKELGTLINEALKGVKK
jgi:hypothetical protein